MKKLNNLTIPISLADAVNPNHTALIVYDMQVGILRQLQGGDEIIQKVGEVLQIARENQLRTYFLRHLSLPQNLMGRFQIRQAMKWQRLDDPGKIRPWFLRGTEAHQIVSELQPNETEAVFDKIGMSAFEGTPLDIALRDSGVQTFLIAGVATEIGIEPTVRQGADLGYIPIIIEDACGAGEKQAGDRAIESMRYMGDALFTTVDGLKGCLEEH